MLTLTALAVPSIESVGAGGGPDDPGADAALLALGAEFDEAMALYSPALATVSAIDHEMDVRNPRPDAMQVRAGDVTLFSGQYGSDEGRIGMEYLPSDIERLRKRKFVAARGRSAMPGELGVPIDYVEEPKASARAGEIVSAYDRFCRREKVLDRRLGKKQAVTAFENASSAVAAIACRVADAPPATTIKGVCVKAKAAQWCRWGEAEPGADETTDERLAWAVIHDLMQVQSASNG